MTKYLLGLAAAASLVAGAAWAQTARETANAPMTRLPTIVPAGSPRASALTIAFIYSPYYGTVLNQGVASITNPATGIYCIVPSTPLTSAQLPIVTPEWGGSHGNSVLADLDHFNVTCASGQIEVRTFDFASGPAILSEKVGFSVAVN
jgi:hypothetical protein